MLPGFDRFPVHSDNVLPLHANKTQQSRSERSSFILLSFSAPPWVPRHIYNSTAGREHVFIFWAFNEDGTLGRCVSCHSTEPGRRLGLYGPTQPSSQLHCAAKRSSSAIQMIKAVRSKSARSSAVFGQTFADRVSWIERFQRS